MYRLTKTIEISAAHSLTLDYESKCTRMHGHNWLITVHLQGETLNQNGMLMDFSEIKRLVKEPLDHHNLNEVLPFNPTAENIAKWVFDLLQPLCVRVDVQESRDNIASYYV
ncbi:MAG: 6-carboxytetrahydropterin synthase QueD [Paludibacteraceae bacterium]|nr:6-carboxytetrahydropterin synthase QueD [Paludibacteraceae bacterium]